MHYKTFYGSTVSAIAKNIFNSSLKFAGKASVIRLESWKGIHSGRLISLSANIRLGLKLKWQTVINTLAYYISVLTAAI